MNTQELLKLFDDHHLKYELHKHVAVFTVEDAQYLDEHIRGAHSKNLFLKDKGKDNQLKLFLVSILSHKRLDLKTFNKLMGLGSGRLSFANSDTLFEKLRLLPGSVTPFGLLSDTEHTVEFILDEDFLKSDIVNFHPYQNDMTVSMKLDSFLKFFEIIQHPPKIMGIPVVG